MRRKIAKTIFLVMLGIIISPLSGHTMDWPHADISCIVCHPVHGDVPWDHPAQNIDDTYYNNLCWYCHNTDNTGPFIAPYMKTHSSLTTDTRYGTWTVECRVCHEPHKQYQFWTYGSASYLFTGVISAFVSGDPTSTITSTGANWTPDEWAGTVAFVLASPSFSSVIISNTQDTLTLQGPIYTVIEPGVTSVAIIYGGLINDLVSYDKTNVTPPVNISSPVRFFRATGPDSFADGVSTQAICEVCHTQTTYHRNDGSGAEHNTATRCTDCHLHTEGFKASCNSCHGLPPTSSGTGGPDGLVGNPSPTGALSAGAHAKHTSAGGLGYPCETCHTGGMPTSAVIGNNKIQIGFDIGGIGGGSYDGHALNAPYSYEGTNGTSVTLGGTKTCSIFCHGDGTSVATGVLHAQSPPWDALSVGCTACHGYPPSYANGYPKANSHMAPGHNRPCKVCHSATTSDGTTITDPANHGNAAYDVSPADASVDFSYSYDAAGGTCSAVACHGGVALQWGAVSPSCTLCHTGHTTGHMATDGSGHPVPDTCTSCHTQYAISAHTGTARNLSNSCGACHVTTGLSFISHSAVPMTAVSGQCTICHIGMIGTHAAHTGGTAHILTTEATCTSCHSATPRVRPTAAIMAACETCHGDKVINHIDVYPYGPQYCVDCHYVGGAVATCTNCHENRNGAGMHSGSLPFAAFSASAGSGINAWKVTLDTSLSDGTISSVNWGDGTDTLTTHTYASAGVKSITLTILNSGNTASVTHSITLYSYPISGTVKIGGVGLANVTITLTGPTSGTTATDSNGAFSFSVRPGTYSVHAAKAGYTMSADVASIEAAPGKTDANFTAQVETAVLTVGKANSALGSVSSSPTGINCDATCSGPSTATFDVGSVVRLTASISTGNTVNSLTCIGGTTANCGGTSCYSDVTIVSGGNGCTAVFSDEPNVVKRVSGEVDSYYPNLTDGLNDAVNEDIFYLKGIISSERVIYDGLGVTVTLKGGYDDSSYTLRSGTTLIRSLTVVAPGSVSVSRLILQAQ